MKNILVTGAGAPGGPGIIKSLQNLDSIRLIVCDSNPQATGRYLNTEFLHIPNANDSNFIEFMIEISIKYEIDTILPLVTKELFRFSEWKGKFKEIGTNVIVSDFESLEIANNKSKLYDFLKKNKIPTPDFHIVNSIEEFLDSVNKLGYPTNPVCFKPSISNGSRGFRIIDENIDKYDLLFNHKPNNTYIDINEFVRILEKKPFKELLVSEYLPGDEYTIDCIVSNGASDIVIPRKRLSMIEGISVKGVFEENQEIINYCRLINSALKLDGPIGIQVKADRENNFKILEINPRIQGTTVAAKAIGINLPHLIILHSFGENIKEHCKKLDWGRKFSRYWDEVYYE